MRFIRKALSGLVAALLVAAAPLGAFTLVESNQKVPVVKGDSFRVHARLLQAALGDGSVKLQPGEYDVQVLSMGDGSVRASFFDRTGRKSGEANGIIAVLKHAAAAPPAGSNVPAVQSQGAAAQKVAPASPPQQVAVNFTKLGFGPNSRSTFSQQGQKLNLEIFSQDGAHGVLISLLLPAVQKVRESPLKQ
jgi:hypothetical protein